LFAQCGGQGYTGLKACRTGSCCKLSDFFSQCLLNCPELTYQSNQIPTENVNETRKDSQDQEGFFALK
jgi:hypothetical protein